MSVKKKAIAVKNPQLVGRAQWLLNVKAYQLPVGVWLIFLFSLVSRIPLILNDLPPYQFCDETVYQNEVIRMVGASDWIPNEFRAGGFNIYPAIFLFNVINFFIPSPLSSLQMLIIGKIFYVVLLPSISILFTFKISQLFVGKVPAIITTLIFGISTFYYMNFWYPDSYIQFGVLGFLYFALLILLKKNESARTYAYLGIFLSIAISTKYTALALLGPALLLLSYKIFDRSGRSKRFWKNSLTSIVVFFVCTLILNIGALFRTEAFVDGFLFNLNNYASADGTRYDGFLYYVGILLVNSFGVFGFISLLIGLVSFRNKKLVLLFLVMYPIILVLLLGDKRWVIARNMSSASVFLIPFLALGIAFAIKKIETSEKLLGRFVAALVALSIFVPFISYTYLVVKDITIDTRVSAAKWISSTIGKDVVIGVNEFCSGESPAQVAGNAIKVDPTFTQNLDYYVLNSYWSNPFSSQYLEKGVLSLIDQSKIHFEQWNSTKLIGGLGSIKLEQRLLPTNYEIRKVIRGNGPDIIILKRIK